MSKQATVLILLLASVSLGGRAATRTQNASVPNVEQEHLDESRYPLLDLSAPPEQNTEAASIATSKRYNNSKWKVSQEGSGDRRLPDDPSLPDVSALPVDESTAVVIGDITAAQALLSADKTGIYSDFTLEVSDVLKQDARDPLVPGNPIETERAGGRVRYASGKVRLFGRKGEGMPAFGGHYLLFLSRRNEREAFHIITGYELGGGKVIPLDSSPRFQVYRDAEEVEFLEHLKHVVMKSSGVPTMKSN